MDPFVITRLSPVENGGLAERLGLPWGALSDTVGDVSAWYGFAGPETPRPALTTYTLDPGLRVLRVDRGGDPSAHIDNVERAAAEVAPSPTLSERPRSVPVLSIPRVLDPSFCEELLRWWHERGNHASGTIDALTNRQIDSTYSAASKSRRDHDVTDPGLIRRLNDMIGRRIVPEVMKTFQYQASRATGFKIACYLDPTESRGYFRAHRDNIAPMSAQALSR